MAIDFCASTIHQFAAIEVCYEFSDAFLIQSITLNLKIFWLLKRLRELCETLNDQQNCLFRNI